MRIPIQLRYLLPQLALATILVSTLDAPSSLAKTSRPILSIQTEPILIAQTSAEDFFTQGVSFVLQKRYQEAIASFDKAIQLKPDDAIAWYGRGIVLDELKR